jgi:hypothetical protein
VPEAKRQLYVAMTRAKCSSSQNLIFQLNSGDVLAIDGTCCRNSKRQVVLRFSRQLIKQIEAMKQKQYLPKAAKIRFIVYWRKENSEQEIRIVLPELYFERKDEAFFPEGLIKSSILATK